MKRSEDSKYLSWFGNRRPVRLLLLAALLTLGILHFSDLCGFVTVLWRSASPLIAGAALAYVLNVIVDKFEACWFPHTKKKWLNMLRTPVSTLLAVLVILGVVLLIVLAVIPGLVEAFTLLAKEVPHYVADLKAWALEKTVNFPTVHDTVANLVFDWNAIGESLTRYAVSGWSGIVSSTVTVIGAVTNGISNVFITLIFAMFMLLGRKQLTRQANRVMTAAMSESRLEKTKNVLNALNRSFSGFIVGQGANSLLLGVLTTVMMLICGFPYAVIVGVINGTTGMIPVIGGYIGAIVSAFLVFTAAPGQTLLFLILLIVLQSLLGNLVYPRLVGGSIGLPGLWVLAAVIVGSGLGGITGMLIGVPLAATAYELVKAWVARREKEKTEEQTSEEITEDV
ncbi:MAG: AI-2E family transporter [Clostridia bacterium]|nr:AI-2E family transporter [Clostridia bacterium]